MFVLVCVFMELVDSSVGSLLTQEKQVDSVIKITGTNITLAWRFKFCNLVVLRSFLHFFSEELSLKVLVISSRRAGTLSQTEVVHKVTF